jgi:glycerophosphoryl diester phosphodiesterase
MPSLRDVLAEFPSQRFLVNFKSADPNEADLMLAYLEAPPRADVRRLAFYGASPADRLRELRPDWRIISRSSLKNCATSYVLTGWFGRIGPACRNTMIFVPANYGWIAWGWPNRFLDRMKRANTEVVIFDAIREGARPGGGIDDAEALRNVPRDWGGGILTDRVEVIAPLLQPE